MPCFHSTERGISGQRSRPTRGRLHGLPDVDVGVSDDEDVRPVRTGRDRVGDARLLRAADEVVDEHADPAPGAGTERPHQLVEVVDALDVLDDDALDAQVVAPDLLDELGVVPALDVDAARQRDARLRLGDVERSGGGARPPEVRVALETRAP